MSENKNNKHTKLNTTIIIYIVLFIVLVIGIASILLNKKDNSQLQNEFAHRFGATYMTMNNPFFEVINDSIRTTVEANGDILITRDPALDSDRQIEQIYDMVEEGVEAIFIAPVDYEKILPVLRKAKEKGIIIIFVDTESYEDGLADGIVVSDNYLAGRQCAQYLMQNKPSAKIVICEHGRTKSSNDRVDGFISTIEGHDEYEIVDRLDTAGQLELAMPMMKQEIESGADFDTIFAINDLSALGAMAALKDVALLQDVSVLGVDGSPEAKAMIKEQLMTATSAQYPSKLGETAVNLLYSIINGEQHEEKVLVPVELITYDNVDDYGTRNWQ